MKRNQGITLIALIITIIVLLILAGVSLNAIVGDNGLIERSQEAKIRTEDAQFKELAESIIFDTAELREQGMTDEEVIQYLQKKFTELNESDALGKQNGKAQKVIVTQNGEEFIILVGNRVVTSEVRRNKGVQIDKDNVGISEEWAYKIDETDGKIIILACTITSGDISIPKFLLLQNETTGEYDEITFVKQLGDEGYNVFSNRSRITSVKFPEGLEVIYNYAFNECDGLNCEINFPSTLKEIGDYAFYKCSGLTGNIIEKLDNSNIIKVGSYAFYGCSNLTGELKLFDNINLGSMVFASCPKITGDINILLTEGLTEIPDGAFGGMSGLTGTPNIPATVTRIGDNAFYGCRGLTGILTIPTNCTYLGENAFGDCKNFSLLSIDTSINSKLKTIGKNCFFACSGLANDGFSIPPSVTTLGDEAFSNCSLKGTLVIPSNITVIPIGCFKWTNFTSLDLNSSITEIQDFAFYYSKLSGSLIIPDSVETLRKWCV